MLATLLDMMPLVLFAAVCLVLMLGYPVALSLAGTALAFAGFGMLLQSMGMDVPFEARMMNAMPNRLYGIMTNATLLAVPLFVFLGLLIEMTGMARAMIQFLASLLGHVRGGLGYVAVLAALVMASISGSAIADTAALAAILLTWWGLRKMDLRR